MNCSIVWQYLRKNYKLKNKPFVLDLKLYIFFAVCEVPTTDVLNGTRHATTTTQLADGRTVEDKWQYKCDDGYLILHSQDGVVECSSNSEIVPKDIPRCVRREFTIIIKTLVEIV